MLASNDLIDLQWVLLWNFETISTPGSDKLQSKTLFLPIFDPLSSIIDSVFDCRLHGVIRGSLMRPNWPKLASLAQKISSLVQSLLPKETLLTFKNIFKRQDLIKPSLVAFKFQTMLCKKDLYSYNKKILTVVLQSIA